MDDIKTDTRGRMICAKMQLEGSKYVLCNVYAPNDDDPTFFTEMIEMVDSYIDCDTKIIGGDFNLVMSPDVDRNGSLANHKNSVTVLKEYADRSELCDIWRVFNPGKRRYTWHRWGNTHKPLCSRINFFLIQEGLVD